MTRHQTYGLLFLVALIFAFLFDAHLIKLLQAEGNILGNLGRMVSWIGNGSWMAVVLLIWAFTTAMLIRQSEDALDRRAAKLLLKLAIILFFAILLGGICVQTLKHLFGRARPELFQDVGAFSFNPLAIDIGQISFPSGNATTIGAVSMVGAMVAPKFRIYFLCFAVIVGASQFLDGTHYASDVVAGLTLGAATSYLFVKALIVQGEIPEIGRPEWTVVARRVATWYQKLALPSVGRQVDVSLYKLLISVLFLSCFLLVIFISIPAIDIAVSKAFFDPQAGFWLRESPYLVFLREVYISTIFFVFLSALVLWYFALRLRKDINVNPAVWGYVVVAIILGPGLIANALFKTYWGRARPAHIDIFGGEAAYTLPFQFAHECIRNCSFVSGEGSGISMVFFILISLLWLKIRKAPVPILAVMCSVAGFGVAMRVIKGRHFFSDSLFAILIMALVAILLYRAFNVSHHRQALTRGNVLADGKLCFAYLIAPFSASRSLMGDLWNAVLAVAYIGSTTQSILAASCRSLFHGAWPARGSDRDANR